MAAELSMDGMNGAQSDQDRFFRDLRAFHAERGTSIDTNARVNGKHVDLHKLFEVVKARGGYDAVSAEKLAWRKVGHEFNLGQTNAAAYAFALKTVYYKNLAAFEIKTVHGKEPPPKEILELVSAKGGDLLSRTVENFRIPTKVAQQSDQSDESGDEAKGTPKPDKMDLDDPGSMGRTSRGLRQAPPQRVLFQPDVSSTRQPRHSSTQMQSPQPTPSATAILNHVYNPASNPNSMSFNIASYEPRPQMPLTLRSVLTPSSNHNLFQDKVRLLREANAQRMGRGSPVVKGMMLPGTGFDGPNIYVRTLHALRSSVPEEQAYALHHLVKISHERGDKYKFEAFPGLAEGLLDKVLEVSNLFYYVRWEVSYADDYPSNEKHVLNAMTGTPDILDRLRALQTRDTGDELETEEFNSRLAKINEAGLVIRNMSLLEENARFLSEQPIVRDWLTVALNLPKDPLLVELTHYALDIAEQLTKYWALDTTNPLYSSLVQQLDNVDRGAVLTTLRAVSRISMNLEDANKLQAVPLNIVQRLFEWMMLDDEELVHACLDFLYQYTAVPDNVAFLLLQNDHGDLPLGPFIAHLTRLLLYNSHDEFRYKLVRSGKPPIAAREIPTLPQDLLTAIVKIEEPERSSQWLKTCFEENPEEDITQIALWHAYQTRFSEFSTPQNPLLPAADFIKNVSNTFTSANAQVINGPSQKFIIKGISPRHSPMDLSGRVYQRCLWKAPNALKVCGAFLLKPKTMWEHVVSTHLGIPQGEDGSFEMSSFAMTNGHQPEIVRDCYWASCSHFSSPIASTVGRPSRRAIATHIRTHLPDSTVLSTVRTKHNKSKPVGPDSTSEKSPSITSTDTKPRKRKHDVLVDSDFDAQEQILETHLFRNTAVEGDKGEHPAGLPLTSVLILRNLARNVPKAVLGMESQDRDDEMSDSMALKGRGPGGGGGTMMVAHGPNGVVSKLYGPYLDELWYVMAHNKALRKYLEDLLALVEKGVNG
ncbi:Chromatin structure-remodeling complex protein rsc9 [Agyrium rufum]|nr:Chromatin structure-remodeling complex protein rsc9 [Agyrium rufum]